MSSLFGGGQSMPAPQPVPVQPLATDNTVAAQARADAARAAQVDAATADQKARGRASTIAAGGLTADETQYQRGLLKQKERTNAASTGLLG